MAKILLPRELESLIVGHFALLLTIGKVSNQVDDDVCAGMIAHLLQPLSPDVLEALPACDVEDEKDAA